MPPAPVPKPHHGLSRRTGLEVVEHTLGILYEAFDLLTDPSLSDQDREPQPGRDNQPRSE
jgi:hypothetical protein